MLAPPGCEGEPFATNCSFVDFLTDPASIRSLLEALRRAAPNHKGVWRFQAVLREEERDKIPTRADVVAVRVLQQD
jgi:hypothetical protein